MVMAPGRSASQASDKAAAMTPMTKTRTRIIGSRLCFRGRATAEGDEHCAFELAQCVVGGAPCPRILEPAGKRIARLRRQRLDLLDGGGKIALVQRRFGSCQHGGRLVPGRVGADSAGGKRRPFAPPHSGEESRL